MICSQCATNFVTPPTKELESPSVVTPKRIGDLLACNVAPLGGERDALSDLMSRTQDYATSLDTRITELRATLEYLLDEKSTTEQRLRDLKLVLHPIRIVPPEILAKIFEDTIHSTFVWPFQLEQVRDGVFADSIGSSSPSYIVSQVSSAWRRTALTTQTLWRFVHVSFDRYPRDLSTSIFLNRVLARSAEQTLFVALHATVDLPAMTVILMASKRWQTAAISFPPPIYRLWNVPGLSFRSLAKLHLHLQLDGLHTLHDVSAGKMTQLELP
ncbi:hypothetical protein CPB85DRAFT_1258839 [Mucidula mucida]|nr:hypothetical protein CPB85DRAFT_1258839 [Mucidula mucida]